MNVVYHHRTRGAGAEGVHIMGIVKALRSLGHGVDLLSLPGSDPEDNVASAKKTPEKNSVEERPGGLRRVLGSLFELTKKLPEWAFELVEFAYSILSVARVYRTMASSDADFLYERYSLFLFGGVLAAKLRSKPIVLEVNDSALVERVRPLSLRRLARAVERWVFRNCDGIVFISSRFQSVAKEAYGDIAPSIVCPNGADIELFSLAAGEAVNAKRDLGLEGKVVCGYVGAFVYWHGIDWFVEEILPVLADHPNLVLLLVGDGVVFEPIQTAVQHANLEKQVVLTGRVPHSEVRKYVAAMDYGILPDSNDYGSPMKLFEMMAMEVPLVSPAFSPIEEVVVDGETGWLFPVKDKAAAVEQVLDLVNKPDEVDAVSRAARQYIVDSRQWRHNAEAVLRLVDQALESAGRS